MWPVCDNSHDCPKPSPRTACTAHAAGAHRPVPTHAAAATGATRPGTRPDGGASQPRSVPPVAFSTAATILPPTASISASVSVRSRGWRVTAMATDALP